MLQRKCVLPLNLLLFVCLTGAASITDGHRLRQWTSDIDKVVEKLQNCVKFPGLSLSIVKVDADKSSDTLTRNYGVLDVDSGRPVDDNSRFCIGSLTKGFTAALLTQLLHENGTYHLDSLVRDILGEDFQLINSELTTKTTIKDILAHRVGIAKYFGAFLLGYNFTRPQIIRRIRHLPQVQPFRSSRVFNNFLYVVAGQVVEKLGPGKNKANWWENQLVERVLKPLKMEGTTFADRVADWGRNFALPHALQSGKLVTLRAKVTGNILRPLGPAGSICTTATDMSKWLNLLLKGNNNEGVLNNTVIDQQFNIENAFDKPSDQRNSSINTPAEGYGLGWVIGKYRGTKRVFHSGFSNYYYSMVSILPDKRLAIYTTVNGPHLIRCDNGMKALHFYLMDLMLGLKPWLNVSNICSYPRQSLATQSEDTSTQTSEMSSAETSSTKVPRRRRLRWRRAALMGGLAKYEGTYENPFFGPLLISLNRTADKLQLNYGYYGKALLEPLSQQLFQMKFFSSIWYQSESDDMKLFAARNMFNIQFGNFNTSSGAPQKLVVFLFDTESPPIFIRQM